MGNHTLNLLIFSHYQVQNWKKIFNDGYLGSHNDEERSEMRYAMRIAESASHQIFERSPRLEDILLAYMFQCVRLFYKYIEFL